MKNLLHGTRLVLGAALAVTSPTVFGQTAPALAAQPGPPRIQFSETAFDFGKVTPTDTLKHDFIVTNTGAATLEITAVQPGCGCTTAGAWDRRIEPGKTGKVPIQFNPGSFTGPVSKGVSITCNDPAQPSPSLQIQATVWRPIEVQPPYAYFMPVLGEETNETKMVRIINNMDQNVTLEAPRSTSPLFSMELKTVRPGKEFELHVTYLGFVSNASPQGNITINTSATNAPVLDVKTLAMTQPAVVTFPSPLTLPAGPFKADYQGTITVRNNGRSPIKLSAPSVNVDGVKVQMQEIDRGRLINLSLVFPAGFQLRAGQSAELTVNTSHPKSPVLKVPITQMEPVVPVAQPAVITGGAK